MFLLVCVILFTGGGLPQCMLGYHPPEGGIPPGRRHPPPPPPGTMHPWDHASPLGLCTPRTMHPPGPCPTPRHMVNERPVRILLECILVLVSHSQKLRLKICQKTCPFLSHRPDHLHSRLFSICRADFALTFLHCKQKSSIQ